MERDHIKVVSNASTIDTLSMWCYVLDQIFALL